MKIDRYQGFVFDGEGYITDHQSCKKVIKFNFKRFEDEKADNCMRMCLDYLNKDSNLFKEKVIKELQSIYDYLKEKGQDDDAAMIYDFGKLAGILLIR